MQSPPSYTTGLYIHIPFCAAKCDYCDFLSFTIDESRCRLYIDALINEISQYKKISQYKSSIPIDTIYIGGGTPTVLPARLLQSLFDALPAAAPNAEITCEANPGTLDEEKIALLAAAGVNRISMGLQAWQAALLENIGRRTTREAFLENYKALRNVGFKNINLDIMFALPGQSLTDWEETLSEVCALGPEHISAYSLTPEENTPLWSRLQSGSCPEIPDEETDRLMYHSCKDFLNKQGYQQYEISNFCKPGFESRHNLRYWTRKAYKGLGLAAHSFEAESFPALRYSNTDNFELYIKGEWRNQQESNTITKTEAMAEHMFLGLRLSAGVSISAFTKEFCTSPQKAYGAWINKMKNEKLLKEERGHLSLTALGMDLANIVMAGFLE